MICCLFLFACSSSPTPSALENWMAENQKLKVLSTTAMIDDLVGEIGKDRVDHLTLIIGDIDPHSYELLKGDDEKMHFAEIVFFNGLGLEHGASLRYLLSQHPFAVAVGEEIQKACPSRILWVDDQIDPHVWMDISLWVESVDAIVGALSKKDLEGAPFYRKNGELLKQRMWNAHKTILDKLSVISPEKKFLVTSHDAFNYFARTYLAPAEEVEKGEWKERFKAPEGLAPEGQLSVSDIQKIIRHVQEHHIQVVFPESNVSRDSLKKIVQVCAQKEMGIKLCTSVLYGDAMGPTGSDADSYLKMMEHNAEVLFHAWK